MMSQVYEFGIVRRRKAADGKVEPYLPLREVGTLLRTVGLVPRGSGESSHKLPHQDGNLANISSSILPAH